MSPEQRAEAMRMAGFLARLPVGKDSVSMSSVALVDLRDFLVSIAQPPEPLTKGQVSTLVRDFYAGRHREHDNSLEAIVRYVERAHGIGAKA